MTDYYAKTPDSAWERCKGGRSSIVGGEGVRRREVAVDSCESGEMVQVETLDAETALALVHHCINTNIR
jgi:hypothetical protein